MASASKFELARKLNRKSDAVAKEKEVGGFIPRENGGWEGAVFRADSKGVLKWTWKANRP